MGERDDGAIERHQRVALESMAIRRAGLRVAERTTIGEVLPKPPMGLRWHVRRGAEASHRP